MGGSVNKVVVGKAGYQNQDNGDKDFELDRPTSLTSFWALGASENSFKWQMENVK